MNKRILMLLLLAVGCTGGAQASLIYSAPLSGLSESPANASPGSGSATLEYDSVAHTLRVDVLFADLIGTTTAAHIHCCILPPGNVGVALAAPGFPLGVTSGSYGNTLDLTQASSFTASFVTANGGTVGGAEAALATGLANGRVYFNIHTNVFPGGEIRGFPEIVPVPAAAWLFGSGLLGLVGVARRKAGIDRA